MRGILFLALALALVSTLVFAEINPSLVYTADEEKEDVLTSEGRMTIIKGAKLGGNPTNYVTIQEQVTILTKESGEEIFPAGTMITCDHPPGTPDPCGEV